MAEAQGTKADLGKAELYFNPPEIQRGMARAFAYGAAKYAAWNWTKGIAISRLYAATLRHLLAWFWEEDVDPESGLNHLDHAAASLAMLMGMAARRGDLDDRPLHRAGRASNPGLDAGVGQTQPSALQGVFRAADTVVRSPGQTKSPPSYGGLSTSY